MLRELAAYRTSLIELKDTLKKLRKYPGNATYNDKREVCEFNVRDSLEKIKARYGKTNQKANLDIIEIHEAGLLGLFGTKLMNTDQKLALVDHAIIRINTLDASLEDSEHGPGQLFSFLKKTLPSAFARDISDLELVYGKSGNCTAFMLRKILEKTAYLSLAKNGLSKLAENSGAIRGLDELLNITSQQKAKNGQAILLPKTREKIRGLKFLGDAAAHNPLVNVEMEEIVPQLPFITIALKEMALATPIK